MMLTRSAVALPLALAALLAAHAPDPNTSRNPTPGYPAPQQAQEACRAGRAVEPGEALERALTVMGVRAAGDRVLHFKAGQAGSAREQSDRWYPPYLTAIRTPEYWIDPRTGAERIGNETIWPGSGGAGRAETVSTATGTWGVRDTIFRAFPVLSRDTRRLDPWTTLLDWHADSGVRYAGECKYRDYWRSVFERGEGTAHERLYLDPKSGYPLKVEYEQSHYLWGQQHIEYVYSTWITPVGGGAYPGAVFRVEDGETVISQTVSGPTLALIDRASAPRLNPPEGMAAAAPSPAAAGFPGAADKPDTVRVSAQTFLLITRAYTETVTLQRDTVYLLDATSGESRARDDSTWIATLFPGRHPVVVVVTDLAWPHVSGLRFWVARGARVVTHEGSRGFLQQVTARHWTLAPDALEKSNAPRGAQLRIQTLTDSLSLAGGRIHLYPIDGAASEGALIAWIPGDQYLWASDFVQTVRQPTQYGSEVWNAAHRAGITPQRFAAEHLPLTAWDVLDKLVAK